MQDNRDGAAKSRMNVAVALYQSGRFEDAREYAQTARDGFASYGPAAVYDVQKAQAFIKQIEEAIAGKTG